MASHTNEERPPLPKKVSPKCFHLFNCDKTYNLDVVEKLLNAIKGKSTGLDIDSTQKYFRLFEISNLCETIVNGPSMDFVIFVVNAYESRLSINEDNAGIGYAKIYRALLRATGERVIVVIGGDDNYRDAAEEEGSLISRWARRQVSSQFKAEFMDGSKSFIFSWDTTHRKIHEEALLHFLDPEKKGQKFVRKEKPQPTSSTSVDQKQVVTGGTATVNAEKAESEESRDTSKSANTKASHLPPVGEKTLEECSRNTTQDVTAQENSVSLHPPHASTDRLLDEPCFSNVKSPDGSGKRMKTDTNMPSLDKKVVILCRDQSDSRVIKDLFGDESLSMVCIFSGSPDDLARNSSIFTYPLQSCFIVVEARIMKNELQRKSNSTPYQYLLKNAERKVESKVVVIIRNDDSSMTMNDENSMTSRIKELLDEKGVVLWWKGNNPQTQNPKRTWPLIRSKSLPDYDGAAAKGSPAPEARPINPVDFTLLLKTRLHHGKISYQGEYLERVDVEGQTLPPQIEADLMEEWHSTDEAELLVYRENETGNYRTVVNPMKDSKAAKMYENVKDALQNVGDYVSALGNNAPMVARHVPGNSLHHTM